MKRLMTATAMAVATSLAQAAPLYHPPGSNLTYGAVSNGQSITSDITNPAAGAARLEKDGGQFRLGVPGSIGGGIEFGEVDQLYDRIDAEAEKFQNLQTVFDTTTAANAVAEVDAAIASLNSVLADVETNGYAKVFGSVNVPLVVAHKGLGGSFVFNVSKSFVSRATGLHETVAFNGAEVLDGDAVYDDPNDDIVLTLDAFNVPTGFTVDNDSSVLLKAGLVTDLSLGYSTSLFKTQEATLFAGVRGHYYTVEQSRVGIRMAGLNDVEQQFEDALDQDRESDSGMGVDLGVLWVSEHYRLGATLANANEPSFDAGTIDLTGYDLAGPVAQELAADDSFTMEKQLQLEAAIYTASQNWVISGSMDANAVKDVMGDEYRWATVSAAYATDSWWLPGIRAGIRKNLAGTKINYYSLGATIAMLNLDVAWSTDEVDIDGETLPRGAMVNLGLDFSF